MSITIDEISAEVERPETPAAPALRESGENQPEAQLRRQCDLLARLERRAARLRAD
jgi:hypothetical protein